MSTVFSHIVQKRLSQEYENVATDALGFIVGKIAVLPPRDLQLGMHLLQFRIGALIRLGGSAQQEDP